MGSRLANLGRWVLVRGEGGIHRASRGWVRNFLHRITPQVSFPLDLTHCALHAPIMAIENPTAFNILELLQDGVHFSERVGNKVHVINSLTGARIILDSAPKAGQIATLKPFTDPSTGVTHYLESPLTNTPNIATHLAYNPAIIDEMCAKIASGERLTNICKQPNFPSYPMLSRWRNAYPEIDAKLERARRDRAEHYADSVHNYAQEVDQLNIDETKLKIDASKWLAGVDAPEKYSPKAKVEASIQIPTQIIITTGVDRTPLSSEADVTPAQPDNQAPTIPPPGVSE